MVYCKFSVMRQRTPSKYLASDSKSIFFLFTQNNVYIIKVNTMRKLIILVILNLQHFRGLDLAYSRLDQCLQSSCSASAACMLYFMKSLWL